MEKDTVFISLKEYNELRDFKKEIMNGKVFVLKYWRGEFPHEGYCNKYYTNDKVVEDFNERNSNLADEINRLRNQLTNKKCNKKPEQKEITLEDVKNMNWFELWKWKRR